MAFRLQAAAAFLLAAPPTFAAGGGGSPSRCALVAGRRPAPHDAGGYGIWNGDDHTGSAFRLLGWGHFIKYEGDAGSFQGAIGSAHHVTKSFICSGAFCAYGLTVAQAHSTLTPTLPTGSKRTSDTQAPSTGGRAGVSSSSMPDTQAHSIGTLAGTSSPDLTATQAHSTGTLAGTSSAGPAVAQAHPTLPLNLPATQEHALHVSERMQADATSIAPIDGSLRSSFNQAYSQDGAHLPRSISSKQAHTRTSAMPFLPEGTSTQAHSAGLSAPKPRPWKRTTLEGTARSNKQRRQIAQRSSRMARRMGAQLRRIASRRGKRSGKA